MPYGRYPPSSVTLGELADRTDPDWTWFYCDTLDCTHHVGIRFKTLAERYGAATRWDDMLARMKCTKCGHRGATARHPSHDVNTQGWQRFPGAE